MLAVLNGHTECVYSLLSQGASVGNQDRWGRTALHRGVRRPQDHAHLDLTCISHDCIPLADLCTGGDRPGRLCGGSPSEAGQRVCQRHAGSLPPPSSIGLWPSGRARGPAAGQLHLPRTSDRQPGLHSAALGLLQRCPGSPDRRAGSKHVYVHVCLNETLLSFF